MAQGEIRAVLEQAIDELPDAFRAVFVARIVEGMTVEETADLFGLKPETVKTRLHRARALLRDGTWTNSSVPRSPVQFPVRRPSLRTHDREDGRAAHLRGLRREPPRRSASNLLLMHGTAHRPRETEVP